MFRISLNKSFALNIFVFVLFAVVWIWISSGFAQYLLAGEKEKLRLSNQVSSGSLETAKGVDVDCIGTEKEKRELEIKQEMSRLKRQFENLPPGFGMSRGGYGCESSAVGPLGKLDERCAIDAARESKFEELRKKAAKQGNIPLKILSKPRAKYSCEAKLNDVQGTVLLSVVFLKTGKIGKIKVIEGLPFGLLEIAVEAAKKIKFEPEIKNGKTEIVTKKLKYHFTIY